MDSTNQLVPTKSVAGLAVSEGVKELASAALSPNTLRAYRSQWVTFSAWCADTGRLPLPAAPETLAEYINYRATEERGRFESQGPGRKVATIDQSIAAIRFFHEGAGLPAPHSELLVRVTMKGTRRTIGTKQREAEPLLAEHLRSIMDVLPSTLSGLRDRALLLVGVAGGFRGSELVGLTMADVAFNTSGLEANLRRSKTDQEAKGRLVAIAYAGTPDLCPVRALRAWLDAASIQEGPLFREVTRHGDVATSAITCRSLVRIIKRSVAAIGLDASKFSGHSLRAGFVTQAKIKRKDEASIMRQTGHKSVAMVRRYDRRADLWRDNASVGLFD